MYLDENIGVHLLAHAKVIKCKVYGKSIAHYNCLLKKNAHYCCIMLEMLQVLLCTLVCNKTCSYFMLPAQRKKILFIFYEKRTAVNMFGLLDNPY